MTSTGAMNASRRRRMIAISLMLALSMDCCMAFTPLIKKESSLSSWNPTRWMHQHLPHTYWQKWQGQSTKAECSMMPPSAGSDAEGVPVADSDKDEREKEMQEDKQEEALNANITGSRVLKDVQDSTTNSAESEPTQFWEKNSDFVIKLAIQTETAGAL